MQLLETKIRPVEDVDAHRSEVTMSLGTGPTLEESPEFITFRVSITHKEAPLLAKVQAEALSHARHVIALETQRLEPLADADR